MYNHSDLSLLLEKHGFRFTKSLGQNFLCSADVAERSVSACKPDKLSGAIEIGAGAGILTVQLARNFGRVAAIELDRSLKPVLREVLNGYDNADIIFADALKTDLRAVAASLGCERVVACSNLPYGITTDAVSTLLRLRLFDEIVIMIQKEAAVRLLAKPSQDGYCAFTVLVNVFSEPEILFDVPPDCFMPKPHVTSSVLTLHPRKIPLVPEKTERLFFSLVSAAFGQRRKTLYNALSSVLPKDKLAYVLDTAGIDRLTRGEALSSEDFLKIAEIAKKP